LEPLTRSLSPLDAADGVTVMDGELAEAGTTAMSKEEIRRNIVRLMPHFPPAKATRRDVRRAGFRCWPHASRAAVKVSRTTSFSCVYLARTGLPQRGAKISSQGLRQPGDLVLSPRPVALRPRLTTGVLVRFVLVLLIRGVGS